MDKEKEVVPSRGSSNMGKNIQRRKKAPNFIHVTTPCVSREMNPVVVLKKVKLRPSDSRDEDIQNVLVSELTDGEDTRSEILQNEAQQMPGENEFIHAWTNDELEAHIQKCLEMSSENKITPKNAFALQLIDCMNFLMKKEDFTTMACTLDAGTKIYSYRVDSLHQQVLKLANEVVNYDRRKKGGKHENEQGVVAEDTDVSTRRQKRRENKKTVIGTAETLNRKWKAKDPREGYIKLDGLAGAIMSGVRRDPDTLAFSLENDLPFWKDWKEYKPTTAKGTVTLPRIRLFRERVKVSRRIEGSVKITEDQCMIANEKEDITENQMQESPDEDLQFDDPVDETEDDFVEKCSGDHEPKSETITEEVEVISTAMKRLNEEADVKGRMQGSPTRFEAMKLIFDKDNDYHYLNMKNAHYWAGPEFWKRPTRKLQEGKDKSKLSRKNKAPADINYHNSTALEKWGELSKKQYKLTRKTVISWKTRKFTLPKDLNIENKTFLDLFNISRYCDPEGDIKDSSLSVNSSPVKEENDVDSTHEVDSEDVGVSSSSQDTLNNNFYEGAPGSSASPDVDPLNSAFYDAGPTLWADGTGRVIKVEVSSSSPETFGGTTLVQPPKRITFQPIKYSARPVRVDMHNLKHNMMGIIDQEGGRTTFSGILSRLEKGTAGDPSPAMVFLALLTLANEYNLRLTNSKDRSEVYVRFEDDVDVDFDDGISTPTDLHCISTDI